MELQVDGIPIFHFLDKEGLVKLQDTLAALKTASNKIEEFKQYVKEIKTKSNFGLSQDTLPVKIKTEKDVLTDESCEPGMQDFYTTERNHNLNENIECSSVNQNIPIIPSLSNIEEGFGSAQTIQRPNLNPHNPETDSKQYRLSVCKNLYNNPITTENAAPVKEMSVFPGPSPSICSLKEQDNRLSLTDNLPINSQTFQEPIYTPTPQPEMNENTRCKIVFNSKCSNLTEADVSETLQSIGLFSYSICLKNRVDHSFGFITFKDEESAGMALRMNGQLFSKGLILRVRSFYSDYRKNNAISHNVFQQRKPESECESNEDKLHLNISYGKQLTVPNINENRNFEESKIPMFFISSSPVKLDVQETNPEDQRMTPKNLPSLMSREIVLEQAPIDLGPNENAPPDLVENNLICETNKNNGKNKSKNWKFMKNRSRKSKEINQKGKSTEINQKRKSKEINQKGKSKEINQKGNSNKKGRRNNINSNYNKNRDVNDEHKQWKKGKKTNKQLRIKKENWP